MPIQNGPFMHCFLICIRYKTVGFQYKSGHGMNIKITKEDWGQGLAENFSFPKPVNRRLPHYCEYF